MPLRVSAVVSELQTKLGHALELTRRSAQYCNPLNRGLIKREGEG